MEDIKIYKKEMHKAMIELFKYINSNVEKDILLIPDPEYKDDFMGMAGIWFSYLSINGHSIMPLSDYDKNKISKNFSVKFRPGNPGVKFVVEDDKNIAIYMYNGSNDNCYMYYEAATVGFENNFVKKIGKKLKLNIR